MSAAIQCPYVFLGVFDYTHTSSDGTTSCSHGNNLWDICSDTTMMTFNLAQCSTKVSYSGKTINSICLQEFDLKSVPS